MRIIEIASAEEQVALLHLIMDKTWESLAQQAAEQKQADDARKAQAKTKIRSRSRTPAKAAYVPTPKINTPPITPTIAATTAPMQPMTTANTLSNPIQKNVSDNPSNLQNDALSSKPINATKSDDDSNDRYSKNGIADQKK